jgi:hypothetical protein
MIDRRTALVAGLFGTAGVANGQVANAACPATDATRQHYMAYLSAFNAQDIPGFTQHYTSDVQFMLGAKLISGRQGIVDWYEFAWKRIREHCAVRRLIIGEDGLAVELQTRFEAFADWPDFPSGPLLKGDVRQRIGFVHYDLRGDKFSRVATALHRVIDPSAHWDADK